MNEEILREGAEKRTGPASTEFRQISPGRTKSRRSLCCRRAEHLPDPGRRTGKSVSLVFWSLSTEF